MTALGENGPIVVAGAGPTGALASIYLARQGHDVVVFEARPDMRRGDAGAGRSINLALATRGIVPLVDVGVIDQVDAITIPMRGRMIHVLGATDLALQPYGINPNEVIHSVSRRDLNAILLGAAEATGNVTINFGRQVTAVDFARSVLTIEGPGGETADQPFGTVFGSDGAGSVIRDAVLGANGGSQNAVRLGHDYKELTLPAATSGGFLMDPNALHIWPRGEFMLIALANPGGDFTVTLFAPNEGAGGFEDLQTSDQIARFFNAQFPDFAALVPDLVEQFQANPTGRLATTRVSGWSHRDQAVLIGDAAHAIVPFHGQGMNLGMESVRSLDKHLRANPQNVETAFAAFEKDRKPDAEAIADMALENYVEMRAGVLDPDYVLKRELALELERRHPERVSPRYNMVMFATMPYSMARTRANTQAELLATLTNGKTSIGEVDFQAAAALVSKLDPLPGLDPLARPEGLSIS